LIPDGTDRCGHCRRRPTPPEWTLGTWLRLAVLIVLLTAGLVGAMLALAHLSR
jgi:hypothetical protein